MSYTNLVDTFAYKDLVTHTRLDELADNDEYLRGGGQLATQAKVSGTCGTGGTLATSLSVSGPGMLGAVWLYSDFMGQIRLVITVDGVVVMDETATVVRGIFVDEMLKLVAAPADHALVEYCRGIYLPFWESLLVQACVTAASGGILYDDFEDGTLNKWSQSGSPAVESKYGSLRLTNLAVNWELSSYVQANQDAAYGTWSFDVATRMNGFNVDYAAYRIVVDGSGNYYDVLITGPNLGSVVLRENGVVLASASLTGGIDTPITIRIERDTDGTFRIYEGGALRLTHVDTTITSSTTCRIYVVGTNVGGTGSAWVDNVQFPTSAAPNVFINHAVPLE